MASAATEYLERERADLTKRAKKAGKSDGKRDRGPGPVRPATEGTKYQQLVELCQTVEGHYRNALREREHQAKQEETRIEGDIKGSEDSIKERSERISELEQELDSTRDENERRLIRIRVSREKDQLEKEKNRLAELRKDRVRVEREKNKAIEDRENGQDLYEDMKDDVLEAYRVAYQDSQAKKPLFGSRRTRS